MWPLTLALALGRFASSPNPPEQLHLSLAGADADRHPTGMCVSWFTPRPPMGASTVQYGTSRHTLYDTASGGAAVTYLGDAGYHHRVPVTGLQSNARYFYRVGSDADGWGTTQSFKTAPAAADANTTSFQIGVFGDMGYLDSAQRPMVISGSGLVKTWSASLSRTRLEVLKNNRQLDWIWHLGDIGYIDDAYAHHPFEFTYEKTYNDYMNWLQNLTASMPYHVSVGNHESECHSPACLLDAARAKSLSNFTAYNARWRMPAEESGARAGSAMWCSWNYGPVHFISVNTETDWDGAEEQRTGDSHNANLPAGQFGRDGEYIAWVEADLKAASDARAAALDDRGQRNRAWAPSFIVAGGHRPFGDLGPHAALFAKYGVDLYLSGHGHSYSRSAPVNGTTFIMAGGAGCDEMDEMNKVDEVVDAPPRRQRSSHQPGYAAPMGSTLFTTSKMAVGTLRANSSALYFRLHDSASGDILDHVTITRADHNLTSTTQ